MGDGSQKQLGAHGTSTVAPGGEAQGRAARPGCAPTGGLGPPAHRNCGPQSGPQWPTRLTGRSTLSCVSATAQPWTLPLWALGQGRTRRSIPLAKVRARRAVQGLHDNTKSEERVRDLLSQEEGGWTDNSSSARPRAASADPQGDPRAVGAGAPGLPVQLVAMPGMERRPGDSTASARAGQDMRKGLRGGRVQAGLPATSPVIRWGPVTSTPVGQGRGGGEPGLHADTSQDTSPVPTPAHTHRGPRRRGC